MPDDVLGIRVECHAGYRGEETPRRFWIADRLVTVAEILDRWLAPDHRYFKVAGDDGDVYILRSDVAAGRWEMTMFRRGGRADEAIPGPSSPGPAGSSPRDSPGHPHRARRSS